VNPKVLLLSANLLPPDQISCTTQVTFQTSFTSNTSLWRFELECCVSFEGSGQPWNRCSRAESETSSKKGLLAMMQETSRPGCERPGFERPGYEEGFVDVTGARAYYVHAGSGRPMLLIHGLVGSSANWRNNIDALAAQASVYAIDLVNMGKSQRVGGLNPALGATARRIVAVMDALGLAEADIVAHSHGGAIALMLAALHPERVGRLILFAPANPYCRSSDLIMRICSSPWGGFLARLLPYLPPPIQRLALGQIYGGANRVVDSCLREVVDGLRKPVTLDHVLSIVRGWSAERAKLKTALRRVKWIPALLVWGDQDCTVSFSSAVKLHRKLRASELVVLPGRGHGSFEETPEEANRIMLEWLSREPSTLKPRDQRRTASSSGRTRSAAAMRRFSPGT
jgi:pimeloyl-ACP methyl ester carboxylesterase